MTSRAVLVTGCSSGIGRAVAERLLAAGWPVWASARNVATLDDLQAAGARTVALDVTDEQSMQAAVAAVTSAHGAVGALVNNAGYGLQGPVEQLHRDEVRRQFETNTFGPVRLAQLVLPGMRAQRSGRIVNVSSMGGRLTLPGGGAYHASKYALEAFSDALRFEVAGFGVRVSLVEPGPVLTPWVDVAVDTIEGGDPDDPYAGFRASLAERVRSGYTGPSRRVASTPEQVAKVVERALSARRPRARYVVGPVAHGLVTMRRVSPDRVWDLGMASAFSRPR